MVLTILVKTRTLFRLHKISVYSVDMFFLVFGIILMCKRQDKADGRRVSLARWPRWPRWPGWHPRYDVSNVRATLEVLQLSHRLVVGGGGLPACCPAPGHRWRGWRWWYLQSMARVATSTARAITEEDRAASRVTWGEWMEVWRVGMESHSGQESVRGSKWTSTQSMRILTARWPGLALV